jgi:hypothetical protein
VIIRFKSSRPLSLALLSEELKELVDDQWDWLACKLSESEFSVVFPSQATLRMGTRSGRLFLPIHKVEVEIREAFLEPQPTMVLPSTWVQISGLPGLLLETDRLMVAMVMVGRPLEVDQLSLRKFRTEPIRMHFKCKFPERIQGSVPLVVNGESFSIGLQVEGASRGGGTGSRNPPCPPPGNGNQDDDDEYDDQSPSEKEWNRYGRKDQDKLKAKEGSQPLDAQKGKEKEKAGAPAVISATLQAPIDEYGTNLSKVGELPAELLLMQGLEGLEPSFLGSPAAAGDTSMDTISQVTDMERDWAKDSAANSSSPLA